MDKWDAQLYLARLILIPISMIVVFFVFTSIFKFFDPYVFDVYYDRAGNEVTTLSGFLVGLVGLTMHGFVWWFVWVGLGDWKDKRSKTGVYSSTNLSSKKAELEEIRLKYLIEGGVWRDTEPDDDGFTAHQLKPLDRTCAYHCGHRRIFEDAVMGRVRYRGGESNLGVCIYWFTGNYLITSKYPLVDTQTGTKWAQSPYPVI